MSLLSSPAVKQLIAHALREDVGSGDATTIACVPPDARGAGVLVSKAPGIVCGVGIMALVFHSVDPRARVVRVLRDGARLRPGTIIARVEGRQRSLLTAERTALNFLQHLSGIATATHAFVQAVRGTRAVILDTRKTTPLLRALEKYAVVVGGGTNHRARLDEMMLIKDNHIAAAGSIAAAVADCITRRRSRRMQIEVETSSIEQVREAMALTGIDRIMLDNFTLPAIRRAVALVDGRIPIEVSGGVILATVRAIAKTGVDYISVGAITHSAPALDISFTIGAPPAPSHI